MLRNLKMNTVIRAAIVCTIILIGGVGRAYSSALWGNLRPGPYPIGFKTILTYDESRAPVADAMGRGKSVTRGRQIQISLWYPARITRGTLPVKFGDYIDLLGQDLEFRLTGESKKHAEEKFLEQPSDLGGDIAKLKSALPMLRDLKLEALKNAPPANGSFPLIVFLDFRAPATNSIMSEYLASHGFVVATTSLKGTHEADLDVGLTGVETIATDIGFVIGSLDIPTINRDRLALIGVGITASGCLALVTRNPRVDALVSLDGGIPTAFEDRILKRTPYFDISAIRLPMLAIYAPHPNVDPSILSQYKYSTRHLIHFPKMSEFHFLNYGMLERFAHGIIGKPPGNTHLGFEWASRYVLNFLKAYLTSDAAGLEFLRASPKENRAPPELLSVSVVQALRAPPTVAELKEVIQRDGIQSLVLLYHDLKKTDPRPFTQETIVSLFNWLSFRRDPDWKARRELSLLRLDSYPDSARAHFSMAQVLIQLKEREQARKHFIEAIRLLETDPDLLLDYQTRKRIEQAAKQSLKDLEG
jgi:hypothetical protein